MTTIQVVRIICLLVIPGMAMSQNTETGFLNRSVDFEGEESLFQVYIPREYNSGSEWPVILFLHGSGERGEDGLRPTQVGLGGAIRFHPERWPAIAVFPQIPAGESWSGPSGGVSLAALELAVEEFNIDESRVYLTGLSLGGQGVWRLAYEHPEKFAALVPICGFIRGNERYPDFLPESAEEPYLYLAQHLAGIPVWIFHGDADSVVPVEGARHMAAALQEVGASVKYSELPGVGHNAWDPAYGSKDLPTWLFKQGR